MVWISWGSAESLWPEGMRAAAESALRAAIQKKITVVAAAGDKLALGDGKDGKAHVLYPADSRCRSWPVGGPRLSSIPQAMPFGTSSYGLKNVK